ncbi:hypothetical protein CAP35_15265 [Chitinophagaceae bacterium IBVUCB1]|nr:hypothetical protein CAP35_15265 [Chitinophagaceae bacterium IBVUCB1]
MLYGGWIVGAILVGFAGVNKKGGFIKAFILSLLLSPFVGLLLTLGAAKKNPIGCKHCGNKDNEAEYCGVCGKNE